MGLLSTAAFAAETEDNNMSVRAMDRVANLLPLRPLRTSVAGVATLVWCACAAAQPCESYWYAPQGTPPFAVTRVDAMTLWDPDGDGPRGHVVVLGGVVGSGRVLAYDTQRNKWMTIGASLPGLTKSLAVLPGGELVAACDSTVGGVLKWNGTTWDPLANTEVNSATLVKVSPTGELYAAGSLRSGSTFTAGIARWNGAAWERLGPVESQTVNDFIFLPSGKIVAVGTMTGGARVAVWDGAIWEPLVGPGLNAAASLRGVAVGPDGRLLICGISLGNSGPVLEWTGASWSNFANSRVELGNWASTIVPLSDGRTVVAGEINSTLRAGLRGITAWDGVAWRTMNSGVSGQARRVLELPNGDIAVGGPVSAYGSGAYLALWFYHFGDQDDPGIDAPFAGAALGLGMDNEFALTIGGTGPLTFRLQRQLVSTPGEGATATWMNINPGAVSLQCASSPPVATIAIDQFATHVNLTINLPISARSRPATCHTLVLRGIVTSPCGDDVTPPITLTFCPSDFNGDRETNLSDLFDYLDVWFDQFGSTVPFTTLSNANFDASTVVTAADLFAFLDRWTTPDPACAD